jgi:hypothetical protein
MLFMVVERFKPGKAPDIYRRFRERGRMAPDDVKYESGAGGRERAPARARKRQP